MKAKDDPLFKAASRLSSKFDQIAAEDENEDRASTAKGLADAAAKIAGIMQRVGKKIEQREKKFHAELQRGEMRILILDEKKISKLRKYAEAHPIDLENIKAIIDGRKPSSGHNPKFVIHLDDGFKIAYTVEEHPECFHHASISVNTKGKYPHTAAVEMIVKAFGCEEKLSECCCFLEEEVCAVNVVWGKFVWGK